MNAAVDVACDGDHAPPECGDRQCWHRNPREVELEEQLAAVRVQLAIAQGDRCTVCDADGLIYVSSIDANGFETDDPQVCPACDGTRSGYASQVTAELQTVREQLAAAVANESALRLQLMGVQEHLAVVSAHEQDLVRDGENLSDALAECAYLLHRCTPGGFRDRELAPFINGYRMLAGADANARLIVRMSDKDFPDLGTPYPDAPGGADAAACGDPPPKLAAETHLPCAWPAGHAGDHLWKPRDPKDNGISGQVPR